MYTVDLDIWQKKDRNTDERLLTPKNVLAGFLKRPTNADGTVVPVQPANMAVGVGDQANAQGDQSVCVGPRSQSLDREATAVGANSKAHLQGSTAVGESSEAQKRNSTVVGHHSKAAGLNTVHVGQGGVTAGDNSTAVGKGNSVSGKRCTVVGKGNTVTHDDNVMMGNDGTSTQAKVFQLGTNSTPITDLFIGNGNINAAPNLAVSWWMTGGFGSNVKGSNYSVSPGLGTGNAAPSTLLFYGSLPGASGSALHALCPRVYLNCYKAGLTAATANAISTFNTPVNNSAGGCWIEYTIYATDGTDYLSATGLVSAVEVNKAGAYTTTITKELERTAVSAGTISTAWTIASTQIKVNPTFTVVTPNSIIIQYSIRSYANAFVQPL